MLHWSRVIILPKEHGLGLYKASQLQCCITGVRTFLISLYLVIQFAIRKETVPLESRAAL